MHFPHVLKTLWILSRKSPGPITFSIIFYPKKDGLTTGFWSAVISYGESIGKR